jgi:hypothetical protein
VHRKTLILTAVVPLFWACQDATGPENAGQVTVRFEAAAAASPQAPAALAAPAAAAPIDLGNGAVIDEILLIISEIELEGEGGECLGGEDDDCEEIEVGPFLVSLLDENGDEEINAVIPAGSYDELEFEVEDLEADDDDDGPKQAVMVDLLAELRTTYENFPSDASMVVHGTCDGQDPAEFTVYFSADIEVEKEFATPFEVPGDQSILVHLDPSAWFANGGQPMDLCSLDGQTLDLEGEFDFESGVEVEDDD